MPSSVARASRFKGGKVLARCIELTIGELGLYATPVLDLEGHLWWVDLDKMAAKSMALGGMRRPARSTGKLTQRYREVGLRVGDAIRSLVRLAPGNVKICMDE
eukprot:5546474-Amphidinium_carterae.1